MTTTQAIAATGRRVRRDYRLLALGLTVLATTLLGYGVHLLPGRGIPAIVEPSAPAATPPSAAQPVLPPADLQDLALALAEEAGQPAPAPEQELAPAPSGKEKRLDPRAAETARILQAAQAQIQARRYDTAIATLDESRERIKQDPRSYLLLAKALERKADYQTARDFYGAAIDKDPFLADAYWGFATTSEAMGQLDAALGAMRIFLHVQPNADRQKLKIAQARSAIWEWESKLGRGPWGASKGIPPGFSAEELKRDERGVGIKIPLPETKQEDGSMKYEIKHQEKFQIFKP